MQQIFDIFVPGRVCLFGEHSDWAGAYRRFNSKVLPGEVIIAGTNQGIHARVQKDSDLFILNSVTPEGKRKRCVLPMEREALLAEAEKGEFFSYAAGVAYYMLTFYEVGGIEMDNYRTTLPVRKGLSSSAALCVLVARAFNKAYDLKLTVRAEMEAAYQGEIFTPSRCGRMDQGCAFGQVPVLMHFNGDHLKTNALPVDQAICMLVADLKGSKDTIKILADLNKAYPFASDELQQNVQKYLGEINHGIVQKAIGILHQGDVQALGALMSEAQRQFDTYLMQASPVELSAPKLHQVLNDKIVQSLTYGGKGVGSQGDGCVQFVAKDENAREELTHYLETNYGMDCFPLDIKPPQTVRKAIIPAAGYGTRMFPASKAVKKELFPIITPDGIVKPIILAIVEEAVQAGIEEVAIIVRSGDEELFSDFFNALPPPDLYNRLSESARNYCHYLQDLGRRLTFVPQQEQEGFGHAVYCARDWVGGEPFLLMLGDHIYDSSTDRSCAEQLVEAFERNGRKSVLGVYRAKGEEVSHYGTLTGEWVDAENSVLEVSEIAEKPTLDYARRNLVTKNLGNDEFLCIYGQYILTPTIFDELERQIASNSRQAGEIQLTTSLQLLRQSEGILAMVVQGEHYDTGLPQNYLNSLTAYFAGQGKKKADKSSSGKKK